MTCAQLLVGNRVGSKGEIACLTTLNNLWTHNETLAAWSVEFPTRPVSEYHRNFALITISDKTESELLYLTEPLVIDGTPEKSKWYFVEPAKDSPDWAELFTTGEITKTWVELSPYLKERF